MRKAMLTLALLALSATLLTAQEPSRVLNGFEFIPSRIVGDPFAVSYFSSSTGGGLAFDLKTPFIDLDGDTLGTLQGNVAFMSLGFEYQQRFGRWLAVRATLAGSARIGTNEQSMLAQGVTGAVGWNLGATARIMQTRTFILSGALDFSRSNIVGVNPFGFAQSVVDNGLTEDNSLVATANAISGKIGARVGWAPANWIGVTGLLEGGRSDVTQDTSSTVLGGGGTVGVDLKNLGIIPLGLLLSFDSNAFTQNGADLATRTNSFGFGLYWTGWEDFVIGFETTMGVLKRRDTDHDFHAFLATFNLRYWP